MKSSFSIAWISILCVMFGVIPFVLLGLGFETQIILVLVIANSLILTDELLTKAALKMGCREMNLFFNFLKGKIGGRLAHFTLTVTGFALLLTLAVVYRNTLLMSFFALGFAVPVVANALVLNAKIKTISNKAH